MRNPEAQRSAVYARGPDADIEVRQGVGKSASGLAVSVENVSREPHKRVHRWRQKAAISPRFGCQPFSGVDVERGGRSPGPVPEWSSPRSPTGQQSSDWLRVVEEADRGTSVRATPRNGADSTAGRERVVETLRDR